MIHTLHILERLHSVGFLYFLWTEISALFFDDFDNGCPQCILKSLKVSNNASDTASDIVRCMAVAATANRPQTALWQQKPDLPVPWSLIISTKINADEGHFGRGKGRHACRERVRWQRRGNVYVCMYDICMQVCIKFCFLFLCSSNQARNICIK